MLVYLVSGKFLPRFHRRLAKCSTASPSWLSAAASLRTFPPYYETASEARRPSFGELAIMLWLLIKGAKVPTIVMAKAVKPR